ncbi:DCTN2 protein, partial [Zapornia atra]|nr:DCTN2 protein [Zapornia atra]
PDVYETSDVPEDDQAEFEAEELTSTSVEHLIINPNAAYEKFKDKRLGTEGVDFSDHIGRSRKTGYKSGEYEIVSQEGWGCETPARAPHRDVPAWSQKLQTLAAQGISPPPLFPDPAPGSASFLAMTGFGQELLFFPHQQPPGFFPACPLVGMELSGAWEEGSTNISQLPQAPLHPHCLIPGGSSKQILKEARIAELEKRLTQLEATMRCEPDSQNPLLVGLKGTSLMDTVQILQAKVNILDVAVLDQVEARLQSVLGKVNEIAKHKATVQDADTQSKIHQIYETMQRWDPVATTLPDVVQRLVTLRDLHEQ